LPTQAFGERLPAIRNLVVLARNQNVKIPTTVVANIGQKMVSADKKARGYWPTAAELISYHSELLHPSVALPSAPCFHGDIMTAIAGYADCVIDIDGNTTAIAITCTRCLVRYSGGHIRVNGFFYDCIFMVRSPEGQAPEPSGKRMETDLLASDLKKVVVTAVG